MSKLGFNPKESVTPGPYSPGVVEDDFVYISGQGTYDPSVGQKYLGDMGKQCNLAMENLKRVIEETGNSMSQIIKLTVFITDIHSLEIFNQVYARYFNEANRPVCTIVVVSALPGGMGIEIEALACKDK